jgi:CDP-diacylglycerol--glycerol-3-phosphate 3-phosphatidyltransferase
MKGFSHDLLTIPNAMSIFRLVAAPSLLLFWFTLDMPVVCLVVGTAAGVTDLFDGIVARRLNQVTDLGALIDQLGDLIFESCCFIMAIMIGELWAGWLVIYLFREFTVSTMRTYVASRGGSLPSSTLGKAKSSLFQYAFFIFFLGAILIRPGVLPDAYALCGITPGRVLIWVAIASFMVGFALSLISGWHYLRAFSRFYAGNRPAPR